jgi:threonine/homoserine/homoserine lactone efflux protein
MDHAPLIAYVTALAALTAAPGPIMAVVVARAVGRDGWGAAAFAAGLCLGDVLAVCAIALGLGFWAEAKPELFSLVKYIGVAYLLWLAVGIWNTRPGATQARRSGWMASAAAGLALCLGNPSTFLIHMLLLPTLAPAGIAGPQQLAFIALVVFAVVATVFFGTILLAGQLHRLVASPLSSSLLSRITAVVIAITSIWMIAA